MIAVLSYDHYEQGTDPVTDWLLYYKADFVKIDMQDLLSNKRSYSVNFRDKKLRVDGLQIDKPINAIFYRRFLKEVDYTDDFHKGPLIDQANFEVHIEVEDFVNSLKYLYADAAWMPDFKAIDMSKLVAVREAKLVGLHTPDSIITNNKEELLRFFDQHDGRVICKPMHHSGYFVVGKYTYLSFTTSLTREMIEELPAFFGPTLLQEKIEADYEIRTFYLDGEIYPTAIVNTSKERNVDVKLNYKTDEINWLTYQYPAEIEEQIREYMRRVNLNTGSLDIIKDKQGRYVFLEVNPVGQYGAPSDRCNFMVEKKMAEWLIAQDN